MYGHHCGVTPAGDEQGDSAGDGEPGGLNTSVEVQDTEPSGPPAEPNDGIPTAALVALVVIAVAVIGGHI